MKEHLIIRMDGSFQVLKWYVDATFAVHPDFKSHAVGCLLLSESCGTIISTSTKQNLNTISSTEVELVGVGKIIGKLMWFQEFIKMHGFAPGRTTLFQDNQSDMLLETKGKASSTKKNHHINIRYVHVADLVAKGRFGVEYCNTKKIVAYFFTKPLQGEKFLKFKKLILGENQ